MKKLTIGHLYPDLLNLYGDRGNIQCFRKRLEWRGMEAEVIPFLSGEKIDIFNWSDNPVILIAEALTPAKVISVLIDETTRKSTVIVPDEQFSLAIGKGGQNVRLASLTTGWKIDIKDETTAYRDGISFTPNVYGY